jgi:hypothetical protein
MIKKWHWKKWTVRDFFSRFLTLLNRFWRYRDLSKNRPHKKHCAWAPTPPPWDFHKFYRILTFFTVFGVFNRAGKTVSKIGIYALPPLKREIYGTFNNSRPIFNARAQFITTTPLELCADIILTSPFLP